MILVGKLKGKKPLERQRRRWDSSASGYGHWRDTAKTTMMLRFKKKGQDIYRLDEQLVAHQHVICDVLLIKIKELRTN